MASAYQRKAHDNHIVALNNVGLSLTSIARRLGVHHTTITYRLKTLGIAPADTRRAFMEEIFDQLSPTQQTWLIQQLGPGQPIKLFVRSLLIKEYINRTPLVDGS